MPDLTAENIQSLVNMIDGARRESAAHFRANLILNVATFQLLIDAGLVNNDTVIQQIERVKQTTPQIFDREDVTEGAQWAVDLLNGKVPLHGSILQRLLQQTDPPFD